MSQLTEFVKKRSINNVVTATVVGVRPDNPVLFDVKLPDLKTVTPGRRHAAFALHGGCRRSRAARGE